MAISLVDLGGGGGEETEVAGLLGEAGEVVGEVVGDEAEPVELAGDGDVGEEAPAGWRGGGGLDDRRLRRRPL